jgi:hypothetical protein
MTDFEFEKFPAEKITALHKHLQLRGGRMTTQSIGVAVLGLTSTEHKQGQLAKILESEAERLDIEPVSVPGEEGLSWRRREPAPEPGKKPRGRDWSLEGTLVQAALLVARELGRAGVSGIAGGFPTAELARQTSERLGDAIEPKHFARSSTKLAGRWRDQLEAAYSEGVRDRIAAIKEHELKTDVPNPNLPDEPDMSPVLVTGGVAIYDGMSLNGNGYEDPLVAHVVELEISLDEAEQRIAELEQDLLEARASSLALEGASKPADVQTHQASTQDALESLLATLEAQLAAAVEGKDAAYREYTRLEVKAEELNAALAAARQLVQVLEG